MFKLLSVIPLIIFLGACTPIKPFVKPEMKIVKQIEYVIKIPPVELLTLPEPVAPLDIDNAKQSDVAKWVIAQEARSVSLENLIKEIAKFFKTEQTQLELKANGDNSNSVLRWSEDLIKSTKPLTK